VSQKNVKNVKRNSMYWGIYKQAPYELECNTCAVARGVVNPLLTLTCSVPSNVHCWSTNFCTGTTLFPCFYHTALSVQWSWTATCISNTVNKKMCKHKQQPTLILVANLCTEQLGRYEIVFHRTHLLSKHCTQYWILLSFVVKHNFTVFVATIHGNVKSNCNLYTSVYSTTTNKTTFSTALTMLVRIILK